MEGKNLGITIAAFVMIIIGVSLIGVVATQEQLVTEKSTVAAETVSLKTNNPTTGINVTAVYTVAKAPTGWQVTDCPLTNFAIKNNTGAALTLTTDYSVNLTQGIFQLKQTTAVNTSSAMNTTGLAYVDYYYCGEGYMTEGWQRTVLDLVPGFFALALLGVGIALLYGVLKSEGIMNI